MQLNSNIKILIYNRILTHSDVLGFLMYHYSDIMEF